MDLKKARRNFFLLLFVSLILALGVIFREFILADIIEPVALMFWAFWRLLSSVDQNVYWVLLVFLCLILAIRTLPPEPEIHPEASYIDRQKTIGRVGFWRSKITAASLKRAALESLNLDVKELLISFVAHEEKISSDEAREGLKSGRLALPQNMVSLLFLQKGLPGTLRGKLKLHLWFMLPAWLRPSHGKIPTEISRPLEDDLAWIESYLEINDEK